MNPIVPRPGLRVRAWLIAIAFVGASCSINPATGERSLTGLMTPAEEVRIGQEQSVEIVQTFGGPYPDPALANYVNRVGQALARHAERQDLTFSFTVLDSPIVNAIALPGGYIYVTRGLLALGVNEAELASVLGHEIGHITARHHAQAETRQQLAGLGITLLGAFAGAPIAQGTQLLAGVYLARYSRDQEYEADLLGIRYMTRAGYDSAAMASLLAKLNGWSALQAKILGRPSADRLDYLATHPNTLDRVREAQSASGVAPAATPLVGGEEYLNRVDGLLFGEPVAQGIVRGRTYLHPSLRIRFEVPAGYQLFDTPRAVYAPGPANALIVFDSVARPVGLAPLDYLRLGARESKLSFNDLGPLDSAGFPAATGWGRISTSRGEMDFRIVVLGVGPARLDRFRILLPKGSMAARLSADEAATLRSFRALTPSEAAAIKPLRVRVVTVKKGQSQSDLARQMSFARYQNERFQVINGLTAGAALTPGSRVKIIRE